MPNKPKDHAAMQKAVCAICFCKGKTMKNISARLNISIKEFILADFGSDEWSWLPTSICGGCYKDLYDSQQNSRRTLKHIDYQSLQPPPGHGNTRPHTREMDSKAAMPCDCSVCEIGRLKCMDYVKYKQAVSEPVGRPRTEPPPEEPEPITVCKLCLSTWAVGQHHDCSRKSKRENVEELVRKTSQKSKERIVSSQLKAVFESKGISTKGGTAKLTTGGTPLQATLGKPVSKPEPKFTNESLSRLQIKMGTSDNKMNVLGNFLRVNCGRASVVNLADHMTERNKKLQEHFDVTLLTQTEYVNEQGEGKKKKKATQEVELPVVFAKDVEALAGFIMSERDLDPANTVAQIGIDDGQGAVKIMLSIKEKETETESKRKRAKYEDGFAPQDFKLSGVKKLFLLLVSPTTERHDNMSSLLGLLGIDAFDFGFSCDIKMILVLLGKQCASSKHCCPFCIGSAPWLGTYTSNTIGSLWADYSAFLAAGSNTKNAKQFNNVVSPPLVTGSDDLKILGDIFNFPEHHVFTGIVGKLVKELERKIFEDPNEGKTFMDSWMARPGVNVSRTVYQGSASFVGDMAELLLKRIDTLEAKMKVSLTPDQMQLGEMYIKAFKQFDTVVHACFGQTLAPNYETLIQDFMTTYRALDISIPLKVHLVESHAAEFLKMKGEVHGLGFYSEQAMESMHYEFKKEWGTDRVDVKHPNYGQKLLNATVRINGKHI